LATDLNKNLVSVASFGSFVLGTTNQVTVTSDASGRVTLSLPQSIHSGANPTFNKGTFTNNVYIQGGNSLSFTKIGNTGVVPQSLRVDANDKLLISGAAGIIVGQAATFQYPVEIAATLTVSKVNVDYLSLDASTLSSNNSNGDINIEPNGTGRVVTSKALIAGSLTTATINAPADITITPTGGDVIINAVTAMTMIKTNGSQSVTTNSDSFTPTHSKVLLTVGTDNNVMPALVEGYIGVFHLVDGGPLTIRFDYANKTLYGGESVFAWCVNNTWEFAVR
jgi:hypothetical protein